MTNRKTEKATDVWAKKTPLLGVAAGFSQAFPTIETLHVEVKETDGCSPRPLAIYDQASADEYINCHNPRCYNGGFRLGQILRGMVSGKETSWADVVFCQGYEGSPKGRRRDGDCDRHFDVKVEIKYRENPPPGREGDQSCAL